MRISQTESTPARSMP